MKWLRWYWPAGLAFIALGMFAIPETLAIRGGGPTFSQWMHEMIGRFPLWNFLWGALVGGLAVHFNNWGVKDEHQD